VNGAQYEGIMGALEKILDRMPVREIPPVVEPVPAPEIGYAEKFGHDPGPTKLNAQGWPVPIGTPARARAAEVAADKRQALAIVRAVLDDWIRGAKENHEAMDHPRENRGSECWRTFAPSDFRNMINDAARELGVDEFPLPESPEEDS
jgi:hypothetical protein